MPPACRFTREQIVAAALAITRERGFDAVTARAIADTLHSSSIALLTKAVTPLQQVYNRHRR